ncbi:rhodanese-like domain-containing protein [Flavobacterium sp.]
MDLLQENWKSLLEADENAVILDVRTVEECKEGIIPNAIMIDIYEGHDFIKELKALDKTKNYYVYCKAGGRSAQACGIMKQMGFAKAYNLVGGFSNWNGAVVIP